MNDTTRRYPRTLNEAFPGSATYACAIEGPPQRQRTGAVLVAIVIAALTVWAVIV